MTETIEQSQEVRNNIHEDFSQSVSLHLRMSGEMPLTHIVQDQKLFVTTAIYKVVRPVDDPEGEDTSYLAQLDEVEFKRFAQVDMSRGGSAEEHGAAIIIRGKDAPPHVELRTDPVIYDDVCFSIVSSQAYYLTSDTTDAEKVVGIVEDLDAEGMLQLVPSQQS